LILQEQVAYWAYNALATVLLLIGVPFSPLLYLLGNRYCMGLGERLGFYSQRVRDAVKGSRPVWIHAASVGEILAAAGLVEQIKKRFLSHPIVISAFTCTGYEVARRTFNRDAVIFFPLDHPWIVKRALLTFDPSLVVFLETEIWPNMLRSAHRRGAPTLLLSGRLSARSFHKYSWLSWFFRDVLQNFTFMGMQTADDADRALRLGAHPLRVAVTGNVKLAGSGNGLEPQGEVLDCPDVKEKSRGRRLLVAGSSHRGEEEILLDAYRRLKQRFPDFQLVLAPRHPQRFAEVERLLKASGLAFEKKSEIDGQDFSPADVFFLDTLGELAKLYAVGDIAFVGGSLVDGGGHNLLEPARVRRPILFGPYMANFAALAREMKERGGAIEVSGVEDLVGVITELLNDPEKRAAMGEAAYQVAADDGRAGPRSLELLFRYFQS
jgi:3-deoxy-D-manno-octulosonic-acid transferase